MPIAAGYGIGPVTLDADEETAVLGVGGRSSVGGSLNTNAANATLTYIIELSLDNETSWEPATWFQQDATPAPLSGNQAVAAATLTAVGFYINLPGGVTHVRVRLDAYTSGELRVTMHAVDTPPGHVLATLVDSSGNVGSGLSLGTVTGPVADDAPAVIGTTTVFPMGALADETTPDSVDEGDVGIPRMTLTRILKTSSQDHVRAISGSHTTNSSLSSAVTLTPPANATALIIQATVSAKNIRLTLDGTVPTASVGFVLVALDPPVRILVASGMTIKVIEEGASSAIAYQWEQ